MSCPLRMWKNSSGFYGRKEERSNGIFLWAVVRDLHLAITNVGICGRSCLPCFVSEGGGRGQACSEVALFFLVVGSGADDYAMGAAERSERFEPDSRFG